MKWGDSFFVGTTIAYLWFNDTRPVWLFWTLFGTGVLLSLLEYAAKGERWEREGRP